MRVGDTVLKNKIKKLNLSFAGYKEIKPMVCRYFLKKEMITALRDAIERLKLNDSSLFYEQNIYNFGFWFRCGFLGMLHLDIFQERLKHEFGLYIIVTVPN